MDFLHVVRINGWYVSGGGILNATELCDFVFCFHSYRVLHFSALESIRLYPFSVALLSVSLTLSIGFFPTVLIVPQN